MSTDVEDDEVAVLTPCILHAEYKRSCAIATSFVQLMSSKIHGAAQIDGRAKPASILRQVNDRVGNFQQDDRPGARSPKQPPAWTLVRAQGSVSEATA